MTDPYLQDRIDNWVADFCVSDEVRRFSAQTQEYAAGVLGAFLVGACAVRGSEPGELEGEDVRGALLGPVAKLAVPGEVREEIAGLCGAFLAFLEGEGRVSGGRALGAELRALKGKFVEESTGKVKPIVRAGSKLGRNDPCPCGSGKKYKKCCFRE
jgi:hypothetical protein